MIAKFPGRCDTCEGSIRIGDQIEPAGTKAIATFGQRDPVRTVTTWRHVDCESTDEPDPLDTTRDGALCAECFTYHRGDCA